VGDQGKLQRKVCAQGRLAYSAQRKFSSGGSHHVHIAYRRAFLPLIRPAWQGSSNKVQILTAHEGIRGVIGIHGHKPASAIKHLTLTKPKRTVRNERSENRESREVLNREKYSKPLELRPKCQSSRSPSIPNSISILSQRRRIRVLSSTRDKNSIVIGCSGPY
jgi:hypothetical protein